KLVTHGAALFGRRWRKLRGIDTVIDSRNARAVDSNSINQIPPRPVRIGDDEFCASDHASLVAKVTLMLNGTPRCGKDALAKLRLPRRVHVMNPVHVAPVAVPPVDDHASALNLPRDGAASTVEPTFREHVAVHPLVHAMPGDFWMLGQW